MYERNRTLTADYMKIVEMTKNCDLFKKLNEEQGNDKIQIACCKAMKMENYNVGENIVRYGDPACDFYVILEGKVGIKVPTNRARAESYAEITAEHRKSSMLKPRQSKISMNFSDRKFSSVFMSMFLGYEPMNMEEVSTLGVGDVFGELAILSDKTRAATVTAKSKVTLGVLSKDIFQKLLGNFSEKRLNEKIEFLQSLPIFKSWSKLYILKISFYFVLKKFTWNQVLYREGSACDAIYFIKSGDVMLSSTCKTLKGADGISSVSNPIGSVLPKNKHFRKPHKPIDLKLIKKSKGMILGLTEVLDNVDNMKQTAYCCSSSSEIYSISRQDFEIRVCRPENFHLIREAYKENTALLTSRYTSSYLTERAKSELSKNTFIVKSSSKPSKKPRLQNRIHIHTHSIPSAFLSTIQTERTLNHKHNLSKEFLSGLTRSASELSNFPAIAENYKHMPEAIFKTTVPYVD